MKKELTNFEIIAITNLLGNKDSLLNSNSKKVSKQLLWDLDSNVEKLYEIREKITKAQDEILSRYLKEEKAKEDLNEKGEKIYKIQDDYIKDYNTEINELMSIKNEVELSMIDFNLLPDDISGKDFRSIKFMIEKVEKEGV